MSWFDSAVGSIAGAFGTYSNRQSGDTTSPFGTYANRQPGAYSAAFGDPIARFTSQLAERNAQQASSAGAGVSTGGGAYANADQFNAAFQKASQMYGTPANLLKSMIINESSGDWASNAWINGSLRGQRMLPFSGIFETTAQSWDLDFDAMSRDPALQIEGMAKIMAGLANQYGGWDNAIKVYFGGPAALNGGFTDENGLGSNAYYSKAKAQWDYLNSMTPNAHGTGGTASYGNALPSMFGNGVSVPDWGEFNAPSTNGLYGYGTEYGLNGVNHTGLDIPMPVGTAYRAPMGGVVMCAGTGRGMGADGGGCAAFNDSFGNGAGRVEVLLDNGVVLIFGHSSTAALTPGTRFAPGQVLGTSGGENSAHVHLEARVRDGGTRSGWRIVDPRQVLGGGYTSNMTYGMPSGSTQQQGSWWSRPLSSWWGG